MRRTPTLLLALLTPFVMAWSMAANAASCTNGKTLYNKTNATQTLSCGNSLCHKSDLSANNILNGAYGAGGANAINNALNNVGEMTGIRTNLGLTASDLDDLAQWIFFAPTCPASAPSLSAAPSGIAFGSVANGSTSAATSVTVTNSGSGAASGLAYTNSASTKWLVSGSDCGASIAAGASCSFSVAYKPAAAGASDTGTYSATGTGSFSVSFTGSSPAATPASLSVAPGSAAFGSVTVGNSSAVQSFTVANAGTVGATGVAFTNSNSAEFIISGNTCGATLSGGTSCGFSINYTPTAAGADTATLAIAYAGATSVNLALSGTGLPAPVAALQVTPAALTFGTTTVGGTSATQSVSVSNTGGAVASALALANGDPAHFLVSGNTCGVTLAGGASCTLNVAYAPNAAGANNAALTFSYAGGANIAVAMAGTGSAAPAANLATTPAGAAFGTITVGQSSAPLAVTLTNSGGAAAAGIAFNNSNAVEFIVTGSTCGATVNAGASCTFNVTYTPSAAGADSATLTINAAGGAAVVMALSGAGAADLPPPPSATVDVIEYFHAEFGHYFITYLPGEIAKLDDGTFKGWARTGKQFKAWTAGGADMVPVCRFFTVAFAPKSSHFYTPFAPECTIVKANTVWTFEGEVFFTQQATVAGVCPAGTVPVYRMYNNGQSGAPNHRYTTEMSVRTKMLAEGWIPEGAGTIGVIMCSPP